MFRFSLYAAGLLLLVLILLSFIVGTPLGMSLKQCFFVAVCLSLSSATLIKYLIEGKMYFVICVHCAIHFSNH